MSFSVAILGALAATVLLPAMCQAAAYSRYRSYRSSTWSIIEIIGIAVVLIGFFIFSLTPRGRDMMRRRRRGGILGSDMSGMYPSMTAAEPLTKTKGMGDCPQCGLAITPGITRCPKCHWNLHPFQTQAAGNPTGANAVDLAGLAAVAAAPILAVAEGIQSPTAPVESDLAPRAPAQSDLEVPAAPAESGQEIIGVVQHDIIIGGVVAFKEGTRVHIEAESPDPERPEYKYVVTSQALNTRFRLSDLDIFI